MSVKKIKTLLESLPEPSVLLEELSKLKKEDINKYWVSNALQIPKNNAEEKKKADINRLLLITFSPDDTVPAMYRNAPRLRTSAELRESPKSGCQYDIKGELNLTSEFSEFPNSYYSVIFESNKINKVNIYPAAIKTHFSDDNLISLKGVKNIEVIGYQTLYEIPKNIGDLSGLESLTIRSKIIESIPDSLYNLSSLKHLDLSGNKIKNLSKDINKLENLEFLDVSYNQLDNIPNVVSKMKSLKDVIIYENPLKDINNDLAFKTYPINHIYNKKNDSQEPLVYAKNILVLNSSWLEIPFSRIYEITLEKKVDTLRVESSEMLTKLLSSTSLNNLSHIKSLDLSWIPWSELGAEGSQSEGRWVKTQNNYSDKARLKEIPDGIKDFQSLEQLDLKGNQLESFNNGILKLKKLKKLNVSKNSISQLPDLSSLCNLEFLDCSSNRISEIPESIFSISKLKILDFGFNHNIKTISDEIHQLQHLESLNLNANEIESLPMNMSKLTNLSSLNLSVNPLKNHLEIITKLTKLRSLDISDNTSEDDQISIPNSITNLKSLNSLNMSHCNIVEIPNSIGELKNLEYLNLENCEIESVDPAIGNLVKMVNLNFAGNRNLNSIPQTIGNLEKLEMLNLYDCKSIIEISDELSKLKLKTMNLSGTHIKKIDFVYEMTQLENLNLFDTKVIELDPKIKQLSNLEVLDIRLTEIASLPAEIGELKKLKEIQFKIFTNPLPDSIGNLTKLEILGGSSFEGVKKPYPKEFGSLSNLKRLSISHDTEPDIPGSFSKLEKLVSLSFRNSEMENIPKAFFGPVNISSFDVSGNYLEELDPIFLAKLNQSNSRNLNLRDNMVTYSASKINKYKALLPYAFIST